MDQTLHQLLALIFSQSVELDQLRAENARLKQVLASKGEAADKPESEPNDH